MRIGDRVKILLSRKVGDRYNYGTIIGTQLLTKGIYIHFENEEDAVRLHDKPIYCVLYVDSVTNKCNRIWYDEDDLEYQL